MTYLIALIIAIALGAVIALLSFTNIGSGFSGQSAKANAQQFANAVSQLEISSAAFEASGGEISGLTDLETANRILRGEDDTLSNGAWLRTNIPSEISSIPGSSIDLENGFLILTLPEEGSRVCEEIALISGLNCSGTEARTDGPIFGNADTDETPEVPEG